MSRIGKLPIEIPNGITVEVKDNLITVKGSKGELKRQIHPNMILELKENILTVTRPNDLKLNRSLHGLSRTLISNMIEGLEKGYTKTLEIIGVGFKAMVNGKKLTLNLGFSHPIDFPIPEGIQITFDEKKKNIMMISGINKELVGEVAAKIRSYKKPEPYKGKGIKYIDEHIVRKAGKTAAK